MSNSTKKGNDLWEFAKKASEIVKTWPKSRQNTLDLGPRKGIEMSSCKICLEEYGAEAAEGHECVLVKHNGHELSKPLLLDTSVYIDASMKAAGKSEDDSYHPIKVDTEGNVILSEESIDAIVTKLVKELKK